MTFLSPFAFLRFIVLFCQAEKPSLLIFSVSFFLNLRLTEKSANSLQSSFFLNHLRLSCQHDVSSSLDNLLCIFLKIETFSYTAGWCKYQSQEFNTDTLLPPNLRFHSTFFPFVQVIPFIIQPSNPEVHFAFGCQVSSVSFNHPQPFL